MIKTKPKLSKLYHLTNINAKFCLDYVLKYASGSAIDRTDSESDDLSDVSSISYLSDNDHNNDDTVDDQLEI